ncbi:hypothetical protein C8F01DRAFT_1098003 [Mycena amicta]|nr:hypothetical protein C8F01DRAFT_1098003 [Mycena amicta]
MFAASPASSSSSGSSSTRSSPVHAASLVDPATHSPALMQLIDIRLTKPVIDYLVESVAETVDFAMGRTTPSPRGRSQSRYLASFTTFATTVLTRAEVTPATVLTALVYISRARPHLSIALEEWALERVFLGALIAASKYTNDSTLKNVHWALCTGVFGKRDVGRIEREFLDVLDWELGVREADLLAHHQALMEIAFPTKRTHRKSMSPEFVEIPLANPKQHTHTRSNSSTSIALPDLEPSSPASASSSLGSFSPPTPAHTGTYSHASAPPKDVPMDVDPPASSGKLHDLIRAFPIPRHHHRIQVAA